MGGVAPVGIIANPFSARDIRRVVAAGSVVPTSDKVKIVSCVLSGLSSVGVERVLSMTDLSGLSGRLAALTTRPTANRWPVVDFVEHDVTQSAADTRAAVRAMVAAGVEVIVVLGGDGTNRIVAEVCGEIPLVSISTGTNNTFAQHSEPTIAGMAAGLVSSGLVPADAVTRPSKTLTVTFRNRSELALVDVAIIDSNTTGARAVWDHSTVRELFLCFAEPGCIGLSSIGAHVRPVTREDPYGLRLRLGQTATDYVHAPIAPGLVSAVGLIETELIQLGQVSPVRATAGVVAIDGERQFRFAGEALTVTLRSNGPRVVDVERAMFLAARAGLLVNLAYRGSTSPDGSDEPS